MALNPPPQNWKLIPIGKDERLWSYLIILMILMMGIFSTTWVFMGKQNIPETYARFSDPSAYYAQAVANNSFANGVNIGLLSPNHLQALSRSTPGDIYLVASRFHWTAPHNNGSITHGIILKAGLKYHLHLGSLDVLHGFELLGGDFIVTLQIVPGYDYIVDFIPQPGIFRIICNEFCGTGHATMTSFLEVRA